MTRAQEYTIAAGLMVVLAVMAGVRVLVLPLECVYRALGGRK